MVVASLFEQFAPSLRGLSRHGSDVTVDRRSWYNSGDFDSRECKQFRENDNDSVTENELIADRISSRPSIAAGPFTRPRKKRFRASSFLASVAADVDIVTDWVFYAHVLAEDREYRAEYAKNPVAGADPYLIPPFLLTTVLVVCIVGTLMWLVLATDGAVAAPLLRLWNVDKISMGYALFLGVIVEDIPQVFLAFLVEDYYADGHEFNNFALVSVVASLYDTMIKLAEAFDERSDIIETGVWCKESLWAHKKTVTALVPLPIPDDDSESISFVSSRVYIPAQRPSTGRVSVIDEVRDIVSDTKLPRLRFISTSLDRTVRVWDTSSHKEGHKREKCVRAIRGHEKGVTCVAHLGEILSSRMSDGDIGSGSASAGPEARAFFLTGALDGRVKLWNLEGRCYRNYFRTGKKKSAVLCISHVNKKRTFACGYVVGVVRLWDIWSGNCIAEYLGHNQAVHSICAVNETTAFLSASADASIRLWDTTRAMDKFEAEAGVLRMSLSNLSDGFTLISDESYSKEHISSKTYLGHTAAVLSVACVEPNIVFLSGSVDKSARLWNMEDGICLRVFSGHTGPVTTVDVVDNVTFLTGSDDKSIKVWDAFTAACVRTYTGHTGTVTSVKAAEHGTFISCSQDRTVKLWVFTAVSNLQSDENLRAILGLNDELCFEWHA